jgi:hypothetical protein
MNLHIDCRCLFLACIELSTNKHSACKFSKVFLCISFKEETLDRIGTLQEDVREIKIMFHFFDPAFNFFPCLLVAFS